MRRTVARFGEGTVVDDEVHIARKRLSDGQREVESTSGDQQDFDAALCGFGDRFRIFIGNMRFGVEQSSVNIHGNQTNRHNPFYRAARES